jgi:hypothetical protein
MVESSDLLVDEVFPHQPVRQWVLSFPFQLRFLFASRQLITDQVLGIVYRIISMHLVKKAGFQQSKKILAENGKATFMPPKHERIQGWRLSQMMTVLYILALFLGVIGYVSITARETHIANKRKDVD